MIIALEVSSAYGREWIAVETDEAWVYGGPWEKPAKSEVPGTRLATLRVTELWGGRSEEVWSEGSTREGREAIASLRKPELERIARCEQKARDQEWRHRCAVMADPEYQEHCRALARMREAADQPGNSDEARWARARLAGWRPGDGNVDKYLSEDR